MDERVSEQASAAVGATDAVIQVGGERKRHSSGRIMEGLWKKLNEGCSLGARAQLQHDHNPGLTSKLGQG